MRFLVLEIDNLLSIFIMRSISAEMVEFGIKIPSRLFNSITATVYYLLLCANAIIKSGNKKNVFISLFFTLYVTFLEYKDNLLF